jgi:hypothetical protein
VGVDKELYGKSVAGVIAHLEQRGVLSGAYGGKMIRLIVHRDITDADIKHATAAFESLAESLPVAAPLIHSHSYSTSTHIPGGAGGESPKWVGVEDRGNINSSVI